MSIYQFAPAKGLGCEPFVTYTNGFSSEELDTIESYCDTLPLSPAFVSNDINLEYRKSKVSWVSNNNQIAWFYDRMAYICRNLNNQYYGFDMWGFIEDFQYTVYTDTEEKYDWHVDISSDIDIPRKLSMVLQLSSPDDYEGGNLEIMTSKDPISVRKEKGLVTLFPSYTLHRVTPVTKGIRKTIVIWATGPSLR